MLFRSLTNVISESTKIAEVLSRKTVSASQLQEILNKSKYPDQTRRMLGVMSGPDESVIIDGEVMKVGGYKLPDFCSDGEVVTYKNCEILNFNSKGEIVFDVSQSEGFSLTPNKALLNNANKVLFDAIKGLAIEDDKWVREIHSRRMEPDGVGRVVLRITSLATVHGVHVREV